MLRQNEPPDAELVARVKAGDREAFGSLYDRYARLVRAVVFRVSGGTTSAGDLTQESFLRAYRMISRLRQPERFGAWVVGIARRVAREHRRSVRRDRHRFGADLLVHAVDQVESNDAVQNQEETAVLMRLVANLPERERLAIHAFFLQEQSANQAAGVLGLSRSGLYALLERALTRLAARMRPGVRKEV